MTTRGATLHTLQALDEVVDAAGRGALTDPVVLTAALRSRAQPPPDVEIAALAAVAGSGAVERMREVRAGGGHPAAALDAAVAVAVPAAGPHARPACALLGAALGLLPRDDLGVIGIGGGTEPTERLAPRPRRRGVVALAVVAVLLAAALVVTGGVLLGLRSGAETPVAAPPSPAPEPTAAPGSTAAPTPTPSRITEDPGAAFSVPELRAAAEPYLAGAEWCERDAPSLGVQESVSCNLGGGVAGIFRKLYTPEDVLALRQVFLEIDGAAPGSIRSLRWEYVDGQPGVRTGVPVASDRPGAGTRVRFVDAGTGFARLYFDEDATAVAVFLGASSGDQQLLRAYWADPDG